MEIKKTKVCSKCGKELPIDNFYKNNRAKDGLQCWCRECKNKYKQANKHRYKEYHRQYRQTHKQCVNQFRNQFKGYYLYIIQDKNNEIVYVGETSNYHTRLMNHLSGNVDSTQELFASNDWGCIKYLNVEHIVANEMELRALENELIHLYQPRLNTLLNIIRDVDEDRLFSIVAELHSILNEWIVFKTNYN